MGNVLSFITNNSLDNLPREHKERIRFFESFSSNFKSILVEDTKYFDYIVLNYVFNTLKKNFEDSQDIDYDSIPKNSFVNINNKMYRYNEKKDGYISLREVKSSRNSKNNSEIQSKYPIAKVDNSFIIKTGESKKSQAEIDLLMNKLAFEIGAQRANKGIVNSILIICSKKLMLDIEKKKFSIGNTQVYFPEICSSVYFTKYGEKFSYLKHSKSMDLPVAIFTGGLEKAVEILQYPEMVTNFTNISEVLIIGDHYLNEKQGPYIESLKILAEQQNIPISLYADSSNIYKKGVDDKVLELSNNSNFFGVLPSELNLDKKIFFEQIFTNSEFNKNMDKLNNFIQEIINIPRFYGLLLATYRLRNAIFTRVYKDNSSKKYLNELYRKFIYLYDSNGFKDISFKVSLLELIENRYVENVKKKVLNYLKTDFDLILVISEKHMTSAKNMILENNLKNKVISAEEIPDEMIYPSGKFLFMYAEHKYYFKWFNKFQSEKLICMFPAYQRDLFSNLLRYISLKINKFDELNEIDKLNISVPKKWEIALPEKQKQKKSLYNYNDYLFEEINVEAGVDEIERLIEDIKKQPLNKGEIDSTNKVELDRIILLRGEKYILATEYFQYAFKDKDDKIVFKNVTELDEEEEILVIFIPYANEMYYEMVDDIDTLLYKTYDEFTKYQKYEFMDWRWKNSLREYVRKNNLGYKETADRFHYIGYEKSLGFFQQWLSAESKIMVPEDPDFIKYIGILTNDLNIEKQFISYYRASEKLKKIFKLKRNVVQKNIIGKTIEEAKKEYPEVIISIETVVTIKKIKKTLIKRQFSNKIINKEDILTNG